MNLQEAISTALDYEVKVRDHYLKGAKALEDPKGKALFELLGKEEQGHVDYLEHCLVEWKKTGKVSAAPVKTLLPKGVAWIDDAKKRLQKRPGKRVASAGELESVKLALQYEKEASGFYRTLVSTLPDTERELFAAFLAIEDGHVALVQAQLDAVTGLGFWFDTMEFALEAG
ncbi:MAG TPA: ferritin family protein [Myxococcales bacterium]